MHLVNFWYVIVFLCQFNGSFFCVCFDILFWLVFAVVDLLDLFLKFINQSKGMSFRVLFSGTNSISNVILVMGDVPDPIRCSEFVSLIWFGSEGLDFGCHLNECEKVLYQHLWRWFCWTVLGWQRRLEWKLSTLSTWSIWCSWMDVAN